MTRRSGTTSNSNAYALLAEPTPAEVQPVRSQRLAGPPAGLRSDTPSPGEELLEHYLARVLASAPPLSEDGKARLSLLLTNPRTVRP